MRITEVRVFPVQEEKLKAFVSIVIEDCFLVSDIKIIQGTQGLFTSMPRKKKKNGDFKDIAHPLNSETRAMLEERILAEYQRVTSGAESAAAHEADEAKMPGEPAETEPAPPAAKTASAYEDEDPTLSESFWTSSKASGTTSGTTGGRS